VDPNQERHANPFGMDEECRNCPALCETRSRVVHGYGDAGADFLFVCERPSERADETGVPFATDSSDGGLFRVLERLGLCDRTSPDEQPLLDDVYLTGLTRCREPTRPPTDAEIDRCEPYLDAEIRSINPDILVPVGERALETLVDSYTTDGASQYDLATVHGTSIRGRGFELVPMIEPAAQTEDETQAWVEAFAALMASDYRQTKGRQGR
jgi:uracil-DNA glycosylase family 4